MTINQITPSELAGTTPTTGVQALFPRYVFGSETKPLTRGHLENYCSNALVILRRLVREKGFEPGSITNADDVSMLRLLAIYQAAAEIEGVLDQGKDPRTANRYRDIFNERLTAFKADSNPFPTAPRLLLSSPQDFIPDRLVRGLSLPRPHQLAAVRWVYGETPLGAVDGANRVFSLTRTPGPPESLLLMLNGSLLSYPGEYTVTGNIITFAAAPLVGDQLVARQYSYVLV